MAQPLNVDYDKPYSDRQQNAYEVGENQIYEMDERAEIQAAELHGSGGRPVHELYHPVGLPSD